VKTSQEIRQEFIDFFIQKGHEHVPSSAVVPLDDPTLLFINAGMNQFKDFFLGSQSSRWPRVVNSQKCIRAGGKHNDLEEVGRDTYHHTFFEMLGNWSFGDYFKAEAIEWAWELLTEVWGLDPNRLYATYFEGEEKMGIAPDDEARQLWLKYLPENRVIPGNAKDNFWEMGNTGPCGPCSELHYDGRDNTNRQKVAGEKLVNTDDPNVIEVWNLVFIQYNRDENGLNPLPAKHVDTGMGFERIVRFLQGKSSNYDTDVFEPVFSCIKEITEGPDYTGSLTRPQDIAYRVLADHARTLTFAIADGALPSNDGRGYVLRRILRRAARFGLELNMHDPFIYRIVPTIVDHMGGVFPEIKQRAQHVINVIKAEEVSFCKTLDRGMEIFKTDIAECKINNQNQLPGERAFRLYDTYGFPLDLTQLLAREIDMTVDVDSFDKLMEQQRNRARAAQKNAAYQADVLSDLLPETHDREKFNNTTIKARLLGYVQEDRYVTEGPIPTNTKVGLVLDRTCAYSESGGQVGDSGIITNNSDKFHFDDTQRIGQAVVHLGSTDTAELRIGTEMTITVDPSREDIRRNHTATHLLQWALQEMLGDHAHQEGSFVCPEYLRFDFTHPQSLTRKEIKKVEQLVRKKIDAARPVTFKVLPIEDAQKLGAMALFSEKYGEHVRVLAIGTDNPDQLEKAFSREFCGGTHVNNTRDIGSFKIIREESVATGVRRITAMTGRTLNETMYSRCDSIDELSVMLKTIPEQVAERVQALMADNKKLRSQLKKGDAFDSKAAARELLDQAENIGETAIIVGTLPTTSVEMIRSQIDWLRKKAKSAAIVLGSTTEDNKVLLFAAATDDLIKKGLKAGEIVKQIAPVVGGGGGGRPQMAQAGGKDPAKINDALRAAREYIHTKLL